MTRDGATQCRNRCGAHVLLRILTTTDRWGVFDDRPVPAELKDARRHWWLTGRYAAPVGVLVDRLQQDGRLSDVEAAAAARTDWDWHRFHNCPNRPARTDGDAR